MNSSRALLVIIVAEWLGTSLWFVGSAVAPDLANRWELSPTGRAALLTATQLGFIVGTLVLALSGLADRVRSHHLFAIAAFCGSLINAAMLRCESLVPALLCRFGVGLMLAGIYPLGMKLVVSWAPQRAGWAPGWLVGAITLGTALPFALRGLGTTVPWQTIVLAASGFALIAAMLIARVGEGPHAKSGGRLGWSKVRTAFRQPRFRASACAYFGHMWELYAFWFLVPQLVSASWAFVTIALGAVGCVVGGWASQRVGGARVAAWALTTSGVCCVVYPLVGASWALVVLMVWGFAVVADSPQFSALSASACPPESIGSGLTIQNSLGFALSVVSIQLVGELRPSHGDTITWLLVPGPVLGVLALRPLLRAK